MIDIFIDYTSYKILAIFPMLYITSLFLIYFILVVSTS